MYAKYAMPMMRATATTRNMNDLNPLPDLETLLGSLDLASAAFLCINCAFSSSAFGRGVKAYEDTLITSCASRTVRYVRKASLHYAKTHH